MITTGAVDVPVLQFFGGGWTHFYNLDFKEEINAGKGMIAVYRYTVLFYLRDCYGLAAVGTETHARPNFLTAEGFLWYLLNKLRIKFPIALLRRYLDVKLVALLPAFKAFFHAGNEVANALDVVKGIATFT